MRLPNGDKAIIDERKVVEYCLSRKHPVGKHKAKLFELSLGITEADARWLIDQLRRAALEDNALETALTPWGRKFEVVSQVRAGACEAKLLSAWIVRVDEEFPRLITCYPV